LNVQLHLEADCPVFYQNNPLNNFFICS